MRAAFALLVAAGCVQSTGGKIVSFDVAAGGPVDVAGHTRSIDNGLGWHVALSTATLHVGAVYLNLTVPSSGAQATNCILPGIYTAEETGGLDVDRARRDAAAVPRTRHRDRRPRTDRRGLAHRRRCQRQ